MVMKGLQMIRRVLFCATVLALLMLSRAHAQAPLTPILNTHIRPTAGIEMDVPQDTAALVFSQLLKTSNGDVVRAQRSAEQWMKLDAETRLYWALSGMRNDNAAVFDAALRAYGLKWVSAPNGANIIFGPVFDPEAK